MNLSTLKKQHVSVTIDNDVRTSAGERTFNTVDKSEKVYRRESYGGFSPAASLYLMTPMQVLFELRARTAT
jgi:hypothetical protein